MNTKRILLSLLISSPCLAYRGYIPEYREVLVRDEKDHANEKRIRELERQVAINARTQVVYVRNNNHFEWLNEGDKTAIKYLIAGIILGYLILR